MNSVAATLRDEYDDNMGAGAARAAAEALTEAARHVASLDGTESRASLVSLQRRILDAILTAERLHERQLSATMIREAHRREDYEAGWNACLTFRRGLRPVS